MTDKLVSNPIIVAKYDTSKGGEEAKTLDCTSFVGVYQRITGNGQETLMVNDPASEQSVVDAISALAAHLESSDATRWRIVGSCVREGLTQAKNHVDKVFLKEGLDRKTVSIVNDLPEGKNGG